MNYKQKNKNNHRVSTIICCSLWIVSGEMNRTTSSPWWMMVATTTTIIMYGSTDAIYPSLNASLTCVNHHRISWWSRPPEKKNHICHHHPQDDCRRIIEWVRSSMHQRTIEQNRRKGNEYMQAHINLTISFKQSTPSSMLARSTSRKIIV